MKLPRHCHEDRRDDAGSAQRHGDFAKRTINILCFTYTVTSYQTLTEFQGH